jgi:hypothetical protein
VEHNILFLKKMPLLCVFSVSARENPKIDRRHAERACPPPGHPSIISRTPLFHYCPGLTPLATAEGAPRAFTVLFLCAQRKLFRGLY